jgi:hypothetical protein
MFLSRGKAVNTNKQNDDDGDQEENVSVSWEPSLNSKLAAVLHPPEQHLASNGGGHEGANRHRQYFYSRSRVGRLHGWLRRFPVATSQPLVCVYLYPLRRLLLVSALLTPYQFCRRTT